ncbi:SH3 domain-containing protein Dlish-like [Oppia nitens]|uniref:SH3 domain-containing protein Dlish-like n=1 Tax=Oppia nitens TaxID=1686743 RepID=UPI0023DBFD4E|nr:SH3 domain-containing protein Dlish-like [Oppia nitens]
MAFLCPVRIRRSKKKKENDKIPIPPSIGRITGSASIETLVRVGIEKEHGLSPDSKMVVLHDFQACVDDELDVRRGQLVNVLYQENDWVYVIAAETNTEGFIPHSYCAPVDSHLAGMAVKHKKIPRSLAGDYEYGDQLSSTAKSTANQSEFESYHGQLLANTGSVIGSGSGTIGGGGGVAGGVIEVHPFFKDPAGRYIVLYTFIARDENDVSVERGEFVTVLNKDDPDWYWIVRCDGQEGFIPSGFVCSADMIHNLGHTNAESNSTSTSATNGTNNNIVNNGVVVTNGLMNGGGGGVGGGGNGSTTASATGAGTEPTTVGGVGGGGANNTEMRFHGTELVMLYDYKAQASDDLSVRRGDWVYADLNAQNVDGWLWAYAPKLRKYGFIPKAYARPPAMTSL